MNDQYSTPLWIKNIFHNWYDPCPLDPKPEKNGLYSEWYNRTYVNPPYSDPLPWVKKAIEENKKGKIIALLLKLDCSTEWFRLLQEADAHFLFINERVKFNGKAPPFCNVIAILEVKA